MTPVILDAGPLIAYFNAADGDHPAVFRWFEKHAAKHKLITTDSVITEVVHLLAPSVALQTRFLEWVSSEVDVVPVAPVQYAQLCAWMRTYQNVPMDFADACVLWLYAHTPRAQILTLDQRGFGVFRVPVGQRSRAMPAVIAL